MENHQRVLESMQASLESESKGRVELMCMKKLEADINELEIPLDHANKANSDAQKNMKRYQEQIRELQLQVEDEQRQRDEIREQYNTAEKRCNILKSEKDEAVVNMGVADRSRRQAEMTLSELRENLNETAAQNASLNGAKRKIEREMVALHAELDEAMGLLKRADEKAKNELRAEQEHSQNIDRQHKALEL